jgi:hypothetical protein
MKQAARKPAGSKSNEANSKQSIVCSVLHAGFFLALLFDPEDGCIYS